MRLSILSYAALTALTSPLALAAGRKGFALGTKLPDGSCKYQADYEADFDAISAASGSKIVRGYSASDCNSCPAMVGAAAAKGFKVVLGVWPDLPASFDADKAALQSCVPGHEDVVYAITVGSETLYRGNFTGPELLTRIQNIKHAFPSIKVGTADSWNKYADGTADALVQGGVDILLVNAFGFWQGQKISNATATYFDDIFQAFNHIQSLSGSNMKPEIWNGETGWPTDGGTNYGNAIAGTSNAKTFYQDGFCGMLDYGVDAFYFEALDELWKPVSIGDDGSVANENHWGAFYANRTAKFDLMC
ncbi:MAG: glycoside hydrolase 3 protein [Chrysothrix sp. TS-e1954]|nr:MAG: glycoside hydrolase 3 protein [Chrysothrix sp. TS-e1954]